MPEPDLGNDKTEKKNVRVSDQFFSLKDKPLTLNPKVQPGKIEDYVSPLVLCSQCVMAGTA